MFATMIKAFAICVSIFASLTLAVVPEDKIDSLPGINFKINFNQYAGYLQPDMNNSFHYWFLESQNNSSEDPFVLWLNGGPGCSSLFGLMVENGPFMITDDYSTIAENVYSWNKVANMLYLESPAWVGFSWSNDPNTTYDDDKTADLNHLALLDFFNKYPEYNSSDLYITGESYGGVYLPMLADRIINDATLSKRFKGVAIGNGDMTNPYLQNSIVPFMYTHLLVGEELWEKLSKQCCNGDPMRCDYYQINQMQNLSDPCYDLVLLISNMPTVVGLDPYNLYDTCYVDTSVQSRMQTVEYANFLRKFNANIDMVRAAALKYGIQPVYKSPGSSNSDYPDCYYEYGSVTANTSYIYYLNQPSVREALHVSPVIQWYQDCNMTVNTIYEQQYVDQSDHLKAILNAKVPILCYNGDVDTVCNGLGDQRFINEKLGVKQIGHTVPWNYTHDTYVVAGWQTRYNGIDYLTVRGSGHYVPHDKPREAMQMITNFIRGRNYSTATGIDVTPQPLLSSTSVSSASVTSASVSSASVSLASNFHVTGWYVILAFGWIGFSLRRN